MFLLVLILPGVTVTRWSAVIVSAALIGLFNAFLWPLLLRLFLPITVLTLGFASLFLNGSIITIVSLLLPGFSISNFWSAIGIVLGLTIISTSINQLLVINDDDMYYRNVIKRQAKKYQHNSPNHIAGIVFLQIDGLAYDVLQRAIRNGYVPTLASWLRSDTYRLEKWETTWSSQTGASQAGILMGKNKDIPAFRWFEKKTRKIMTISHPRDVKEVEKTISKHNGLLAHDGASRGNLYSGDAQSTLLTLSTVKNPDRKHLGQDYFGYFANPYNFTRTIVFVLSDIIRELRSSVDEKQRDVLPRLEKKGRFYPLLRAWTTVIQRDIVVQTLISDMYKGRSVIYADFVGYDEVSHHTGVERGQTIGVLRDIDKQIARLVTAAKDASRRYRFVILSDHGQTQGATFRQRTGVSLEELVRRLSKKKVETFVKDQESTMYLQAAATEASTSQNIFGKALQRMLKNHTTNDSSATEKEIIVMASGCLGLIYFTAFKKRATYEDIQKKYPGLIDGLRKQKFIGFLLVNSKKYGGMVLGKKGTYYLATNRVKGKNPLIFFGEQARNKVKFAHEGKFVADIMVNSFYDRRIDEVASFEEQVGSHGGMGGMQSYPFVFFPRKWKFPREEIFGAESIHTVFKKWLSDIGQIV
jgi:uncharacterized membrane protein YvlD (DUF360 family)